MIKINTSILKMKTIFKKIGELKHKIHRQSQINNI